MCNVTNMPSKSSNTRFSDRSTRYGGQYSVIVPWLFPASNATATAMANSVSRDRATRIRGESTPRRRGGQRRQRFINAGKLQRFHLPLHLLQ